MSLEWIPENPAKWDAPKAEIVGGAPDGIFELGQHAEGDLMPGEWWRVVDGGEVAGYGWMDCTWGEAEILLAVAPSQQGKGVGTFILDQLEREASNRGVRYMYNVVRATHPDREKISRWLSERKFEKSHDDDRLMRRVP
jgi:GNAT superfamily N-acetyltransferase